jgi:cell division protein FtsZ
LLVINNEKLREVCGNLKFSEAFSYADNILATGAKGIAEIITVPGYINVDFADVETVLTNSGVALMGTGTAKGEDRAVKAVQQALTSPLLNDNDIKGTENILLNITSGTSEITMDEIGEIADFVNSEVGSNPNIIWGTGMDESLDDSISITIIATGFESNSIPELYSKKTIKKTITLTDSESNFTKKEPILTANEDIVELEDDSLEFNQRTLDFDIKKSRNSDSDKFIVLQESESETDVAVETKKSEIIKKLNESRERTKERRMDSSKVKDNIDEFESEPAYKRKNLKIDQPIHTKDSKISRYSLKDDEDSNGASLNTNNSYLHDNVD